MTALLKHELAEKVSIWTRIAALRQNELDNLAPQMNTAVLATVHECEGKTVLLPNGIVQPLDIVVFETLRSNELQAIYYSQGTTKAQTADRSWHLYGLAIDFISKKYEWFGNAAAYRDFPQRQDRNIAAYKWFKAVADIAKGHGLKWGGDWHRRDLPHLYWGKCRATPSIISINARAAGGNEAVWQLVKAA